MEEIGECCVEIAHNHEACRDPKGSRKQIDRHKVETHDQNAVAHGFRDGSTAGNDSFHFFQMPRRTRKGQWQFWTLQAARNFNGQDSAGQMTI
jgi:hypothetical protein